MSKGKRKPSHSSPQRKDQPSRPILPGAERSTECICWRFTHVDHEGRWGFDQIDPQVLGTVLRKMADCESMTTGELYSSRRLFKEYDLPGGLIDEALSRLEDMGRADMTKIHRLEFTGTQRLYGFLHDNVFHVVWWDPYHEICPGTKKNN